MFMGNSAINYLSKNVDFVFCLEFAEPLEPMDWFLSSSFWKVLDNYFSNIAASHSLSPILMRLQLHTLECLTVFHLFCSVQLL